MVFHRKERKGLIEECVCVCSRCQEKHREVSSREIKRRCWKVQADSTCSHLHKMHQPSRRERERETERKTDRQEIRKAASTPSDNPAEVLLVVFMFAASFHHSVSCPELPHSKCFFPSLFFVKQERVRCLRALKSERQREKKDLKIKSFDHVSGSFWSLLKR